MTTLIAQLLRPATGDDASAAANLLLRTGAGGMLFWVHGVHKAEGAFAHFARGEGWTLLDEIIGMGVPLPVATAVAATAVQLVAPALLVVGLWTRPAGLVLAGVLAGAVLQNLLAGRDPQLAALYTLAALTLGVWGAGRYSLDARRSLSRHTAATAGPVTGRPPVTTPDLRREQS